LDLSKNHDATGLVMGCPGPKVQVEKLDMQTGQKALQILPTVHIDFVLKIVATQGGEVPQPKIREFILFLRNHLGFHIIQTTADQFQSVNLLQDLSLAGIRVMTFSVDRSDQPYLVMKEAAMEGRVSVYPSELLLDPEEGEFPFLLHDKERKKVDHDKGGEKDVSDGLAAVTTAVLVPSARAKPKTAQQQTAIPGVVPAAVAHLAEEPKDDSGTWTAEGEVPSWLIEDYDT
jgi:hypothetical protein